MHHDVTTYLPQPPAAPSMVDLQAEVSAARDELVASIAELKSQTDAEGARSSAADARSPDSSPTSSAAIRPERVAIVGAVVVGVIALRLVTRRR